ncbi:ECF transporter S component, partial [Lachnotalea glycerini]
MQPLKTKQLILISLFAAIIFILAFTPIGFIQLGIIKATIIHI